VTIVAGSQQPSYHFEFGFGIILEGVVRWSCPQISSGEVQRNFYHLDDSPLLSLGHPLSSDLGDLLDVFTAIHIADRVAPREIPGDHRSPDNRWHRKLNLNIPVRNPELWRQRAVLDLLDALLTFLTDDEWHFEFCLRRAEPRASEMQQSFLPLTAESVHVSLHSGGLDSLHALATLLDRYPTGLLVPVTIASSHRVEQASRRVIEQLQRGCPAPSATMLALRPTVEVPRQRHARLDQEPSQRARAGLYLAFGTVAAILAGLEQLYVSENGIGAISLPMASDHWGARASKAVHPVTLFRFASLVSLVLDRPVSIQNLGLFLTKGEIVTWLRDQGLTDAMLATVSCDRFSYLGEACGRCSSCILRRAALIAAGMESERTRYRLDLLDPKVGLAHRKTHQLSAMTSQVETLRRAVAADNAYAALDGAFPELFRVVSIAQTLGMASELVEQRLLRLYRTYVAEFDAFISRVNGWGSTSPANITQLPLTAGSHAIG
jgi:7-cyano-7-deazaguanine synthase in queuosine biosynthesis